MGLSLTAPAPATWTVGRWLASLSTEAFHLGLQAPDLALGAPVPF